MPDGSNLIVAGRTRQQIALADPNCQAVKVTLIDYDPAIHTDAWVQMTNAGEHIINRTATTEHFRTYFTHNPITHAKAIEQGLVPIDPTTGKPTAAYTKGRQLAAQDLEATAKAEAQAAAKAAEKEKAKAEKQLPGKTKWTTPSAKAKPLSEQDTKQTLISVAALGLSKYKKDRFQFTHTLTQRKDGKEYTVATDGRRITVISQPTYKEDTDDTTQEWHSSKGEKSKENQQAPRWTQVIPTRFSGETSVDFSYYSFLAKGLKGPAKNKHIDSPLLNNKQLIAIPITNDYLTLNPIYVRDAYKQIVDLGKKLGFSPIVKLQYIDVASPVMFTAEHNGIKWQHVIMPVARDELEMGKAEPGDIILGEQPSIYGSEQDAPSGSLSIIGKKARTWRKYASRAFKGRDDGMWRAELDSSQFKYRFGKERGVNIGADEYKRILNKNLVDAIEAVYKAGIKFDDLKEVRQTVKKTVDNYFNTEYITLSKLIHYIAAEPTFNRERAEEFVASNQLYVPQKDISNVWKLESVLDAPELYAAYPQLRDVLVFDEFEEEARYAGASNFRTITLNTNEEIPQSERERTILHEVQHIVQDIEGFASGGNSFEAYEIFNQFRKYLQRKAQERNLHKGEEYSFLKDRLAAFDEIAEKYNNNPLAITRFLRDKSNRKLFNFYDNHDLYKRIAGEIEARNVEYRIDWSDKKRFITPFNDTLDIPAEEVIVTGVSLSLRRRVDRNINSLLNEQESTLARVSNFIRKEAARTEHLHLLQRTN